MRGRLPSLTENEQRVALLISRGHSTSDIAEELGVAADTAANYVAQVLEFMKQRARIDAGEAPRLSNRERQVAELVRRGATNKQIAGDLGITLRTAEDHVYRILRKFGYAARHEVGTALDSQQAVADAE